MCYHFSRVPETSFRGVGPRISEPMHVENPQNWISRRQKVPDVHFPYGKVCTWCRIPRPESRSWRISRQQNVEVDQRICRSCEQVRSAVKGGMLPPRTKWRLDETLIDGEGLQFERMIRGLSLRSFAYWADVSYVTLHRLEKPGQKSIHRLTAEKISGVLEKFERHLVHP